MSQERIEQVADALASVGYEGIVKFDRTEPEKSILDFEFGEDGVAGVDHVVCDSLRSERTVRDADLIDLGVGG